MSDYLNPEQIRDLYAETIAAALWPAMHPQTHARDIVDALAAAGLLPTVSMRYRVEDRYLYAYRTDVRDVPPPPPAPGKGRGPR